MFFQLLLKLVYSLPDLIILPRCCPRYVYRFLPGGNAACQTYVYWQHSQTQQLLKCFLAGNQGHDFLTVFLDHH